MAGALKFFLFTLSSKCSGMLPHLLLFGASSAYLFTPHVFRTVRLGRNRAFSPGERLHGERLRRGGARQQEPRSTGNAEFVAPCRPGSRGFVTGNAPHPCDVDHTFMTLETNDSLLDLHSGICRPHKDIIVTSFLHISASHFHRRFWSALYFYQPASTVAVTEPFAPCKDPPFPPSVLVPFPHQVPGVPIQPFPLGAERGCQISRNPSLGGWGFATNCTSALQIKSGSWEICLEISCYLKSALSKSVAFKGLVCSTLVHSRAFGPDATWSRRAMTWRETGWTTEQGSSSAPSPSLLPGAAVQSAAVCGRRLPERNYSHRNHTRRT